MTNSKGSCSCPPLIFSGEVWSTRTPQPVQLNSLEDGAGRIRRKNFLKPVSCRVLDLGHSGGFGFKPLQKCLHILFNWTSGGITWPLCGLPFTRTAESRAMDVLIMLSFFHLFKLPPLKNSPIASVYHFPSTKPCTVHFCPHPHFQPQPPWEGRDLWLGESGQVIQDDAIGSGVPGSALISLTPEHSHRRSL